MFHSCSHQHTIPHRELDIQNFPLMIFQRSPCPPESIVAPPENSRHTSTLFVKPALFQARKARIGIFPTRIFFCTLRSPQRCTGGRHRTWLGSQLCPSDSLPRSSCSFQNQRLWTTTSFWCRFSRCPESRQSWDSWRNSSGHFFSLCWVERQVVQRGVRWGRGWEQAPPCFRLKSWS